MKSKFLKPRPHIACAQQLAIFLIWDLLRLHKSLSSTQRGMRSPVPEAETARLQGDVSHLEAGQALSAAWQAKDPKGIPVSIPVPISTLCRDLPFSSPVQEQLCEAVEVRSGR